MDGEARRRGRGRLAPGREGAAPDPARRAHLPLLEGPRPHPTERARREGVARGDAGAQGPRPRGPGPLRLRPLPPRDGGGVPRGALRPRLPTLPPEARMRALQRDAETDVTHG